MKVRMLVSRCGPGGANRGDVIDVSTAEAKRMFAASPPQAEKASAQREEPDPAIVKMVAL